MIRKNNYLSEIHLVIKGNGTQNILSDEFNFKSSDISEILINNEHYNSISNTINELENEENSITIKFNKEIDSCENMFKGLQNITEIDLSQFCASNVKNMSFMFYGCSNLKYINFGNIDTSSVQDISNLFYNCINLISIDLLFNTSKVENMRSMFYGCAQIESIDLSKLDTSRVTSIAMMFYGCSNLKTLNFGNINTSSVENMKGLFYNCQSLTSINLSSFDTSSLKDMSYLFGYCKKLNSVDLSSFDTSSVKDMRYLFLVCEQLFSVDLSSFDTLSVENMKGLFYNCTNLISINLSNFDTSSVKDMSYLFFFCQQLTSVDLSRFDTSSVKDMQTLFYHCEKLTSVDISNFDTSLVTHMGWMFFHCYKLKTIIFPEIFNTSNLISMYSMFSHCQSLISINISNFDVSKVTEMQFLFHKCNKLKYLNLPNFSPLNITSLESAFKGCNSLIYMNLNSFQININTNITTVFFDITRNTKYCVNDDKLKNVLINSNNNNNSNCSDICFKENIKLDINLNECIESCEDHGYQYECNNICYNNSCPEYTYPTIENDYICYDRTPIGYYLDLSELIFKKCFNSCKYCYGEGNENSHNCKKCMFNYIILNDYNISDTNCYQKCENYYYFDESNNYKCTDNSKCPEKYNKFIALKNKCIDKCFNDNIYKYEFNNTCHEQCPLNTYSLIDNKYLCYDKSPEGYYLDLSELIFKKCFNSCKYCYGEGNERNNNCLQCKSGLIFLKDNEINNCYNKNIPPIYYFFNNEGFLSKCYESCRTCSEYKKNSTYYNCLTCDKNYLFYGKSTNCLDCAFANRYVNYYQYKCIDSIPDGYYLLNNETKEIDSCYITCKHCNEKGDINNHKCLECSSAYPYNYKNGTKCLDDCSKENLYIDLETKKCYNDCKENDNEKKSNYKNKCISKTDTPKNYVLDSNNNFVSLCNPQTDYEFNNECYKNCPENAILDYSKSNQNMCKCKNLYYLNGEDEICINSNVCPNDYPYLKIGSSECSNCPVTYNGVCHLTCPDNTCITQINENLAICVDKLNDTKILGGICFDDFLRILDNVEGADSNSNIMINNVQGVTINIYQNDINLDEIKIKCDNLTFIDLGQCEGELRKVYNLKPEEKFYIISVDSISKVSNRVTNDNDFEIYLKSGTELKYKNICKNSSFYISSPITKLDLAHFDEAEIFSLQGYNIYDLTSDFYNDKCTPAYINGSDIILKDRLIDIYPSNISICPYNCQLNIAEINLKRFNCSCKIITDTEEEISNNSENNISNQTNDNFINYLLDNINYQIFDCPKIIKQATIKKIINNIGFILGFIFIFFNLISFFIFNCYFIRKIQNQIFELIHKDKKNAKDIKKRKTKTKIKTKINTKNKVKAKTKTKHNNPPKKKVEKNTNNKNRKKIKSKTISIQKINKKKILKKKKSKRKKYKNNTEIKCFDNIINGNSTNRHLPSYFNLTNLYINYNNDNEVDSENYNDLPYTQALRLDKRNIFNIYFSILKMKLEIIAILFYPEEYTHRSLTLSIFLFNCLFSYFMNALLYSDEVVSQKYHNNGQLDLITSIFLSLVSNIISSIFIWIIKILCIYNELLILMVKDIKNKGNFQLFFQRLFKLIKIKTSFYYLFSIIISVGIIYYLYIFCEIYKKSQISLFINYIIGTSESLILSFGISLIICVLRFLGLKCKIKNLYRTSVYINNKF